MNKDQIIKQLRDMAKYPTVTLPRDCEALRAAADLLAQPEQEKNKNGSPCPEFWDWLPKAYNFEGDGNFTKYNMEVAFLAGKQASQPEQEPVAWNVIDPTGKIVATEENAIRGWARVQGSKPTVEALLAFHEQGWRVVPIATPPQSTWVGLDNDDLVWIYSNSDKVGQAISNTEAKLKEKNT